jgi:hypothetical protein
MRPGGIAALDQEQDREHLKLLAVFHYVVAAFIGLFSMLPLIHLLIGVGMVTGSLATRPVEPVAAILGWFLVVFAALFIGCGLAFAGCLAFAGKALQEHTHYLFCVVVAALSCLFAPFGTVLGVFTLVVLLRPSVKALFGYGQPPAPAAAGASAPPSPS